jgi:hypothetical protein
MLLKLNTIDATLTSDVCTVATLEAGMSTGTDKYVVTSRIPTGTFASPLKSGAFSSGAPQAKQVTPVATLELPIAPNAPTLQIPITASHLQFVHQGSGLMSGELQGAVKLTDVTATVIPTLSAIFNATVTASPTAQESMQILQMFDNGGAADSACGATCHNDGGSCAKAGDGKVDPCEIATNATLAPLLLPDVQIYDATGRYAPNPTGTPKDSLSLAIGFSAVPATF